MRIKTEYVASDNKDMVRHIFSGKWHSQYMKMKGYLIFSIGVNIVLALLLIGKG